MKKKLATGNIGEHREIKNSVNLVNPVKKTIDAILFLRLHVRDNQSSGIGEGELMINKRENSDRINRMDRINFTQRYEGHKADRIS